MSAVRNRTSVKNQGNRFCRLRRKSNETHAPAARNCGFAKSWGRPQDKTGFFYGVRAKIRAKKRKETPADRKVNRSFSFAEGERKPCAKARRRMQGIYA